MNNVTAITRLSSDILETASVNDPTALNVFETNEAVTKCHIYFHDEKDGLSVGIRETNGYSGKVSAPACDEFIQLLSGSFSLYLEDGTSETIKAGETIVLPRGMSYKREQNSATQEYFVQFKDSDWEEKSKAKEAKVIRVDPAAKAEEFDIADTSQFLDNIPKHYEAEFYTDPSERFLIAKWDSDHFERNVAPFNRHELMCFLKGSVNLSDAAAVSEDFKAGDFAFVPHQAAYKWKSEEYLSKFYCIVMPK